MTIGEVFSFSSSCFRARGSFFAVGVSFLLLLFFLHFGEAGHTHGEQDIFKSPAASPLPLLFSLFLGPVFLQSYFWVFWEILHKDFY